MPRPSVPRRRRAGGGGFGERPSHRRIPQPLTADRHEIAALSDKSMSLEERAGRIAGIDAEPTEAPRLGDADERVDQRGADAATRERGVDKEHVEDRQALQAGEADALAVEARDKGERCRKPLRERRGVLRLGAPGLALIGVVVLAREFLDAGAKNLDAAPGVGRQKGAQSDPAHRRSSHFVPSFESSSITPRLSSSSRMRSDAAQSLTRRLACRSATSVSIRAFISSLSSGAMPFAAAARPTPGNSACRESWAAACPASAEPESRARSSRPCRWAIAAGVLRSSARAAPSSGEGADSGAPAEAATCANRRSVFSLSSTPCSVQLIGWR